MEGGQAFASAAFCGEGGRVEGTALADGFTLFAGGAPLAAGTALAGGTARGVAGAALAGSTGLGFAGATLADDGAFWGPGRASRPNAAAAPIAERATMARSRRMTSPIPRRASSGENPAVVRVRTERRRGRDRVVSAACEPRG